VPATASSTRAPITLDAGDGEALWFNNDLLILKATGAQTGGAYLLVEEVARRGKVTPLHTHPSEVESFYVLDGEALMYLDGEQRRLTAGGFVSVPAGVPHAYLVTSETARILILVTPGSGAMEDFFRAAGEPAAERELPAAAPLDLERIGLAAKRTGAVAILGPPPFGARSASSAA
jgi:quercetin dioxygenase-like cupin family protein